MQLPAPHLPLIWALEFANPALLAGLAAASIPILIHLLNRKKYKETRWAAMRFLMAALQKNQRRMRIENWILLAVRTLLILMVVGAMAKPFLESFGNVIAGRRTHRVLVLDASLSMGYTSGGATRFEQAKTVASQIVKDSRPGDAISLVLMAEPARVIVGDPSPNLAEVEKEIQELTITHGGADLAATFEAVERVLEVSPSIPQKEIVILTDLQAASWNPKDGKNKDALQAVLAKIEQQRPRSIIVDLSGSSKNLNRALIDLNVDSPVVTVGANSIIHGTIRNFGPSSADGVLVRMMVDGRIGPEQSLDLPVGEDVSVVFNHQFTTPGDHVVELSMDNDPLPLDDRRRLVIPVRESVNVLLVDGHFRSEAFQAETDYLAQALAPTEGTSDQQRLIHAEVVPESQLARQELDQFDVVVLCNVSQFSQTEVNALENLLSRGGGVVFFGGDQVIPDLYNRILYNDGIGLLPAEIGPTVGDSAKKEAAFGINPLGFRHPIVNEFQNASDSVTAGLTRALTWQFHKLILPKDSPARVALAFDNGDPLIIESQRGQGRVIQVATSADAGWTTWPLHRSYPPVMQRIVLEAAAGKLSEQSVLVGQPITRVYGPEGAGATATVTTPGGQSVPVRLKSDGPLSQFQFDRTDLSGVYQIKLGPPLSTEISFAANPSPAESDLTKLEETDLHEKLQGWNFTRLTNWRELAKSAVSVGRRGELHRPLLYGALVFLLLESFLAWKFGHHDSLA